ncbi:hypothetical protein BH780_gp224 [Bacillus phage Eldridge]|uniref:Uncharacterized protein n=1 Tax=Bacillus phage Eldridge TaxID=1776293 RepID=A0A0Y0AGQ6_9CAUD|nr:hypothetical protein BH780_gp224 [Bacillus phage Eldridge]AMB18807.1 hypothetical protein Eldridge_0227 [Bacillus phage Eldridge]
MTKAPLQWQMLVDVLKDIKEGDILEVKDCDEHLLKVFKGELSFCAMDGEDIGATVLMTIENLKAEVRVRPKYAGWREAFEAYENGHRIECEYNGEWVWFCRDITSLEESSMLADKQLDGLLTTKWVIKERNRK